MPWVYWGFVRLFGWIPWNKNQRLINEGKKPAFTYGGWRRDFNEAKQKEITSRPQNREQPEIKPPRLPR